MSQRNLSWLLIVPAVVLFTGVMSFTAPPPEQDYQSVRTLVDVLATVEKDYYRELTPEERKELIENMINGGLKNLDKYAEYYNEEKLKAFDEENKGSFGGIGALIDVDPATSTPMIAFVLYDSPAKKEGLQPGDLILKVNGTDTKGLDHRAVISKVKGDPGTEVTLTLRRGDGEPFDKSLTRQLIQTQSVRGVRRRTEDTKRWEYLIDGDTKIGFIRLTEFIRPTADDLSAALKECEAAGAKALILDLRFNGGGLLDVTEKIADLFLADGFILHTRGRNESGKHIKAHNDGTLWEDKGRMPMAVLVNGGSASASEILAAALQENGRPHRGYARAR